MKITRDNYEIYALDYMDGSLISPDKQSFEKFLEQNPDIKKEMEGFTVIKMIPDESVVYKGKSRLYHRRRKGVVIPLWKNLKSVAAIVVLLLAASIGFYVFNTPTEENPVANIDKSGFNKPSERTRAERNTHIPVDSNMTPSGTAVALENKTGKIEHNSAKGSSPDKPVEKDVKTLHTQTFDPKEVANIGSIQNKENKSMPGTGIPVDEIRNTKSRNIETVAYLPAIKMEKISSASINNLSHKIESHISSQRGSEANHFEIHIPGEFLSETWTDLSFNQFKKKLLPEFLRIE